MTRLAAAAVVLAVAWTANASATYTNPVQAENARAATAGWEINPASAGTIEAYASELSVTPGSTLHLHVSTNPAATYRITVFRLGWYGGGGARRVRCGAACQRNSAGRPQPMPRPDPVTGEVRAPWPVTDAIAIGPSWVSGYYIADVVATSGPSTGTGDTVVFIVRALPTATPSRILVVAPVNTWAAYNPWGGKSSYAYNSVGSPATKISFDRPLAQADSQSPFEWEYPLVRYLERDGDDVSYATDGDVSANPVMLVKYHLVIVAGHSEYWSRQERNAFQAARDAGTNLMFLGANTSYQQIRYDDGGRTFDIYRTRGADPDPDAADATVTFRELVPARPECSLVGVEYQGGLLGTNEVPPDYVATYATRSIPWFAGTGIAPGTVLTGIVGYEWDSTVQGCTPANAVVLFRYAGSAAAPGSRLGRPAESVVYTAPSGAQVFSAGTMGFVWRLDDYGHPGLADSRLQQLVHNMIDDLAYAGSSSER